MKQGGPRRLPTNVRAHVATAVLNLMVGRASQHMLHMRSYFAPRRNVLDYRPSHAGKPRDYYQRLDTTRRHTPVPHHVRES